MRYGKSLFQQNKMVFKKGHKHSEEIKKKISETRKIRFKEGTIKPTAYWKGKHPSETTKKKLSESNKGYHPINEFKKGHLTWNKGIAHDDKTKMKIAISSKATWNKPKYKQIAKEKRSKQVFPIKDTSIEVKIQNFLKELEVEYYTHRYMKEIEHGYQCDIFIPSKNLVIECDGMYWHKYPTGRDIDNIRIKELIEKGFKVLRLWENDINSMDIALFTNNLKESTK